MVTSDLPAISLSHRFTSKPFFFVYNRYCFYECDKRYRLHGQKLPSKQLSNYSDISSLTSSLETWAGCLGSWWLRTSCSWCCINILQFRTSELGLDLNSSAAAASSRGSEEPSSGSSLEQHKSIITNYSDFATTISHSQHCWMLFMAVVLNTARHLQRLLDTGKSKCFHM